MYHFTECDLNIKSVAQLKDVYSQIGCTGVVADKRIKANWVTAILTRQSAQIEKFAIAEVKVDEQTVALFNALEKPKTCTDCPLFKPFNDGSGRGLCCGVPDTSLVVRDHHSQTQDCQNLIDEQPFVQIPGYDFCSHQGIQFKQRTGSETGTTYWYAEASHYYNQPGRQYKTSCFEKLENAVKAAINYLGKCGVDVAEVKEQIIEGLRDKESAKPAIQQATVTQSGSLTFKKAHEPNPSKMVYEVFRGTDTLGIVVKNEDSSWCSSRANRSHATPYEAAAALLPENPVTVAANTVMPEIEVDSNFDSEFGLLYRVWNSRALLGTFYRAIDDKWVVQPCNSSDRPRVQTSGEAQLLIVALSGLLVVDTHNDIDIDELLDKPFDELTDDDWKLLMQQEFLQPTAA